MQSHSSGIGDGEKNLALTEQRAAVVLSYLIDAGVDDQPIQPGRERRITSELSHLSDQLQEDLLRDVARRGRITVKEVEGDRIDLVLVRLVQRVQGIPISPPARFDDLGSDPVIVWIPHLQH